MLEPLLTSDEAEKGEEDDEDDEDADDEEEHIELTDFEARWRSLSARLLAVSDACTAPRSQIKTRAFALLIWGVGLVSFFSDPMYALRAAGAAPTDLPSASH
jgi:hypothetical protein